jgi:hypothetical protein
MGCVRAVRPRQNTHKKKSRATATPPRLTHTRTTGRGSRTRTQHSTTPTSHHHPTITHPPRAGRRRLDNSSPVMDPRPPAPRYRCPEPAGTPPWPMRPANQARGFPRRRESEAAPCCSCSSLQVRDGIDVVWSTPRARALLYVCAR